VAHDPLILKGGRPLTDVLLKKLVREAEEGYDLDKARRVHRGRGRPPLGGSTSGTSPRVEFRVSDEVYQRARERATEEGVTLSAAMRALLTAYAGGPSTVSGVRTAEPRRRATGRPRSKIDRA
jgi:hypothetical protein